MACAPLRRRPSRRLRYLEAPSSLRLHSIWIVGDELEPVFGDDRDVLEPDAAHARAIEAGLDRDHVADDEIVTAAGHRGRLVHLEADTVTEPVEEAAREHLAGLLRQLCRIAVRVEHLACDLHQLPPIDAGLRGGD